MKKIYIALVLGVIFFSGCSQKNKDIEVAYSYNNFHIHVQDAGIYKWLKLQRFNDVAREDGLIEFEAMFVNTSNVNKNFAYKVLWYNDKGMSEKTLSSRWIYTQVEANRNLVIKGISPSMKSADYEILLNSFTKDDLERKSSYHKKYSN